MTHQTTAEKLQQFAASIGHEFHINNTNLVDRVAAVNHAEEMIIGQQYGEFHVEWCRLKQPQPGHLRRNTPAQQQLFQ